MAEAEGQWQPARLRIVHGAGNAGPEAAERANKMLVRIMPHSGAPKNPRCPDANAVRWYEVHPEDAMKINGGWALASIICEHEILTD